jgi:hypothetical protein|tara:strand:- start:131 stop:352 length:222 start_codon:yes stop_codon:yes gene_type:complete
MSKGQQRKIEDLEEIIAHLHKEVELKDYWIDTFTKENVLAKSVKDWKIEKRVITQHVSQLANTLGKVMDIVEK